MNTTFATNTPVQVTALGFRNQGGFRSFPKRIEFDDQVVTFIDAGMQYLVQKGQELIRLFDMSDGTTTYRLRQNAQHDWTLVGTRQAGV